MKSKLLKVFLWVIGVPAAIIGIYIAYVVFMFAVVFPVKGVLSERRVFNADKKELLDACRLVISNYDQYTNKCGGTLRPDEKWLEAWDIQGKHEVEQTPPIPRAIRQLNPSGIILATNYMRVGLRYPFRTDILCYAEGVERDQRLGGGLTPLTNGLWFWDRRGGQ